MVPNAEYSGVTIDAYADGNLYAGVSWTHHTNAATDRVLGREPVIDSKLNDRRSFYIQS